jgi:hypothetical protein
MKRNYFPQSCSFVSTFTRKRNRERERNIKRERERERQRETHRQRDRETERQRDLNLYFLYKTVQSQVYKQFQKHLNESNVS